MKFFLTLLLIFSLSTFMHANLHASAPDLEETVTYLAQGDKSKGIWGSYYKEKASTIAYPGNSGPSQLVNIHGDCVVINNDADKAYFVPAKTAAEWIAFKANLPAPLELKGGCAPKVVSPCGEQRTLGPAFDEQTATVGAGYSRNVSYVCNVASSGNGCGVWELAGVSGSCSAPPPPPPPVKETPKEECTHHCSPLVLDLGSDGLEAINLEQSKVKFDMLLDGKPIPTGWVGPKEAFLVLDHNENGTIDSRAEMFGNMKGYANGYDLLATYDQDKNDLIDAKDPVFAALQLWTDENSDGISQPEELSVLKEKSISVLNLNAEDLGKDTYINKQWISHKSNFFRNDELEGVSYDIWFEIEQKK